MFYVAKLLQLFHLCNFLCRKSIAKIHLPPNLRQNPSNWDWLHENIDPTKQRVSFWNACVGSPSARSSISYKENSKPCCVLRCLDWKSIWGFLNIPISRERYSYPGSTYGNGVHRGFLWSSWHEATIGTSLAAMRSILLFLQHQHVVSILRKYGTADWNT